MEAGELSSLSKKLDPEIGVPANMQPVLDATLQALAGLVSKLTSFVHGTRSTAGATPISNEFAVHLVLAALNRLEK